MREERSALQFPCRRHGPTRREQVARLPDGFGFGDVAAVAGSQDRLGQSEEVPAQPFVAEIEQRHPIKGCGTIPLENEVLFPGTDRAVADDAGDDEVEITLPGGQDAAFRARPTISSRQDGLAPGAARPPV